MIVPKTIMFIDGCCCCCCCSAYLSSCHRTASDANLLDDPNTFHYQDYFVIGEIRTCLGVSDDPMFLWINFLRIIIIIIIIIIIFIYLPSDVISQEKKTATSSRSITKASKYAISLKPNTQTCRVKAIFSHLVRRQRRTERSSKSTATSPS